VKLEVSGLGFKSSSLVVYFDHQGVGSSATSFYFLGMEVEGSSTKSGGKVVNAGLRSGSLQHGLSSR
jgi:hypothetical protein